MNEIYIVQQKKVIFAVIEGATIVNCMFTNFCCK